MLSDMQKLRLIAFRIIIIEPRLLESVLPNLFQLLQNLAHDGLNRSCHGRISADVTDDTSNFDLTRVPQVNCRVYQNLRQSLRPAHALSRYDAKQRRGSQLPITAKTERLMAK